MNALFSTPINNSGPVSKLAYDTSRQYLATISEQTTASIWHRPYREEEWLLVSQWTVTEQQLTELAWAEPSFGSLLVVISALGEISIWSHSLQNSEYFEKDALQPAQRLCTIKTGQPVNAIAFAPQAHGPTFAVASAKGVRMYAPSTGDQEVWVLENDVEMRSGCTSVAWKPHTKGIPPMLLTGSYTGAQIWMLDSTLMRWMMVLELPIEQPVDCVAWANNLGRPTELVAVAAGQKAFIYSLSGSADKLKVEVSGELQHKANIASLKWNPLEDWLAVVTKGSEAQIWRQNLLGQWKVAHSIRGTPYVSTP